MGPGLSNSLSPRHCADSFNYYVTLADEDTNPIQNDDAKRTIPRNMAMHTWRNAMYVFYHTPYNVHMSQDVIFLKPKPL